jgi:hypothetical protein
VPDIKGKSLREINMDEQERDGALKNSNDITSLVDVGRLSSMAASAFEMAQFTPGGENLVRAWYQYWDILRENRKRLSEELLRERRQFSSRVDLLAKSLEYARKFTLSNNALNFVPDTSPADSESDGVQKLPFDSSSFTGQDDLKTAADGIWKEYDRAEEQVLGPLNRRLAVIASEIRNIVRGLCSCSVLRLEAQTRSLIMDSSGTTLFVVTFNPAGMLDSILLNSIITDRIPLKYDFFHDDTCSLESPDGLCWFYDGASDWTDNSGDLVRIIQSAGDDAINIRSMIPVIIPDDGPPFRIRHGNGMDVLEIFCESGFRDRLTAEELSRFNGYMIFLGSMGRGLEYRVISL